jgi:hypothetical protein
MIRGGGGCGTGSEGWRAKGTGKGESIETDAATVPGEGGSHPENTNLKSFAFYSHSYVDGLYSTVHLVSPNTFHILVTTAGLRRVSPGLIREQTTIDIM